MDEKKLLKYAIDYLSKYDSSKNNLQNILKRKILRLNIANYEKGILINKIENIIIKLEKNKFIDDDRYSSTKILSLSNSGRSKNFIFNYLIKKGVNKSQIQNNLNLMKQDKDNWELESAKIFAKKKKLLEKNESYEKKLAKMARAGFSYDICKKILN
ncbi:RecX family transcriptional regulator [Pelagibacteraceae bacterium]|nr:RecX family transcriptional regulator [Pelagibacteraceae bacterium]